MISYHRDLGLHGGTGTLRATRDAVHAERRMNRRPIALVVREVTLIDEQEGLWELDVDFDLPDRAKLPRSQEWTGAICKRDLEHGGHGRTWRSEVLEVDAVGRRLFVSCSPDQEPCEGPCSVFPYDFLAALHDLLHGPRLAPLHAPLEAALHAAHHVPAGNALPGTVWPHAWSVLWGPPGTGKTYTLAQNVAALLQDPSERVLVVAPSNRAVDAAAIAIGARLSPHLQGIERLGSPRKPSLYRDAGLMALLPIQQTHLDTLQRLHKATQTGSPAQRAAAREALRRAQRDVPTLSSKVFDPSVRVSVATLHAALKLLGKTDVTDLLIDGNAPYTTIVIDEAGMVGRAQTAAMSLLAARRVVLVGDPHQLSPVAKASRTMRRDVVQWIAHSGLQELTRLPTLPEHVQRLSVQHRMHPHIAEAVGAFKYRHTLTTSPTIASRTWSCAGLDRGPRAIWYSVDAHPNIDTGIAGSRRGQSGRGRERAVTTRIIDHLVDAFPELEQQSVLFISPFRDQCALVQHHLKKTGRKSWTASTVHAQQGAEGDVVIFDTVHASSSGWSAAEWSRLVNVGISRAKELLIFLCDSAEARQHWLAPLAQHMSHRVLERHQGRWRWRDLREPMQADLFSTPDPETVRHPPLVNLPRKAPDLPPEHDTRLGAQLLRRKAMYPVLSDDQRRLVNRTLSDAGPRLVRGVAGSGKTLVLAHWAAQALHRLGMREVAVLYGNASLKPLIEGLIHRAWRRLAGTHLDPDRLKLLHIRNLLADLEAENGLTPADKWDYDGRAKQITDHPGALTPRFDALFIDEAQDLGHAGLTLAVQLTAVRDGRRPIMIFYDNAQNIYGRSTPNWKDVGLDLRGRSSVMVESFRSTRQATELALNVRHQLLALEKDADLRELMGRKAGHVTLLEAEHRAGLVWWRARFCPVEGDLPHVHVHDSREEEVAAVVAQVLHWLHEEAVEPAHIRIIVQSKSQRQTLLSALGLALPQGPRVVERRSGGFDDLDDAVVLTTPHSFKGYDAEIVMVPGIDRYAPGTDVEHAALYVALTRARSVLWASASRQVHSDNARRLVAALEAVSALQHTEALGKHTAPGE